MDNLAEGLLEHGSKDAVPSDGLIEMDDGSLGSEIAVVCMH